MPGGPCEIQHAFYSTPQALRRFWLRLPDGFQDGQDISRGHFGHQLFANGLAVCVAEGHFPLRPVFRVSPALADFGNEVFRAGGRGRHFGLGIRVGRIEAGSFARIAVSARRLSERTIPSNSVPNFEA
jgi:hypothetical protein